MLIASGERKPTKNKSNKESYKYSNKIVDGKLATLWEITVLQNCLDGFSRCQRVSVGH